MTRHSLLLVVLLILAVGIMGCSKAQGDNEDSTEVTTDTSNDTSTDASMDETSESADSLSVNTINADKAIEMMASGDAYTLIDVRTQAEFDDGHIEGALLLPNDQLETLAPEQLPDKDATILVYCRSGNRSASASRLLVELGYTNVYDFGGIMDWPGEIVK